MLTCVLNRTDPPADWEVKNRLADVALPPKRVPGRLFRPTDHLRLVWPSAPAFQVPECDYYFSKVSFGCDRTHVNADAKPSLQDEYTVLERGQVDPHADMIPGGESCGPLF